MAAFFAAAIYVLILVAMVAASANPAKPQEIAAKCGLHQGVNQIVNGNLSPIDARLTVVCKDGSVWKVR